MTGAKGRPKNIIRSFFLYPGLLEKHNIALQEKYRLIREREVRFEETNVEDADLVIVAYGSPARVAKGLVKRGLDDAKIGLLRPITLYPFPEKRIRELALAGKDFLVVELSAGQMVEDVRLAVEGASKVGFYGRLGGAMVTIDEMAQKAKDMLKSRRASK